MNQALGGCADAKNEVSGVRGDLAGQVDPERTESVQDHGAKRSFLGRAADKLEGSASDCTARGLFEPVLVDLRGLRPLRFMALETL